MTPEQQIEHARPDKRTTAFGTGWNDHRAGFPRTSAALTGRQFRPDYLEGWDARHRLSCAAYSGRLVP